MQSLTYNEDTDYFGMMYEGTWHDIVYAGLQADKVYVDGTFYKAYANGGYGLNGTWTKASWTLNPDTMSATITYTSNYQVCMNMTELIDFSNRSTVNVETTSGTYTLDVSSVNQSAYLSVIFYVYNSTYYLFIVVSNQLADNLENPNIARNNITLNTNTLTIKKITVS